MTLTKIHPLKTAASVSTNQHGSMTSRLGAHSHRLWGQFQLIYRYVVSNNTRNYRSFVIGLITVVLVVTFLALIQNTLIRSSAVFLKLSEDTVGQYDLLLTPNTGPFLNYTHIQQALANVHSIRGCAPRWLVPVNVSARDPNAWDVTAAVDQATAYVLVMDSLTESKVGVGVAWPYRSLGQAEAHVTGSLLRSVRRRPHAGDTLDLKLDLESVLSPTNVPLPQLGVNVTLSSTQVNQASMLLGITRSQLLQGAERLPDGRYRIVLRPGTAPATTLTQPVSVIDAIHKPHGKYPQVLGNVLVVDLAPTETFLKRTLAQLVANPAISAALNVSRTDIENFRLLDYAMSVVCMIKNRDSVYAMERTARQRWLMRVSDAMSRELGGMLFTRVDVLDVVNQALNATQFIQIYMNEIFFTVMTILSLLAILLIYSLLLTDIDEKTFEFGMLRMLGMRQSNLIGLVVLQSVWFSMPGIAGLVLYVPIDYIFSTFSSVPMSFGLAPSAVILGASVGFLLPLVGMLVPIRRALSHTLRNALDVLYTAVNSVTIVQLQSNGIHVNETIVSLLLVTVGFLVYYVVPLSFTFNDLPLFFRILTLILLGMVIGQVLIGQALQHALELLAMKVVVLLMNGTGQRQMAIMNLVSKNLGAHIKRNSKTALMMSLLLAYIIFAAVQFRAQADTLSQTLEWQYGADLVVRGNSFSSPVPEARISNYLASRTMPRDVLGWTYIAYPINSYWPVQACRLGPVTALQNPPVRLVGVQQNVLDVALTQYYFPLSTLENLAPLNISYHLNDTIAQDETALSKTHPFVVPDPPIVRVPDLLSSSPNMTSAYTQVLPVIISEALATRAYIGPSTGNLVLQIDHRSQTSIQTTTQSQIARALTITRKFPGIPGISRFVQVRSPVLISMVHAKLLFDKIDTWAGTRLRDSTNAGTETIDGRVADLMPDVQVTVPKQMALIRLKPGLSSLEVESIINNLNAVIGDEKTRVDSLRYQLESTELAAFFINILFYIVAFVGILLAFFVLWLSFNANLRENAWEMGVLRAIGLDSHAVVNLYVYEAIGIVLATVILGSVIGIVTAVTLTLQFGLFTEMPFRLNFPALLYTIVVLASVAVAMLGAWIPAKEYAKKQIALALKGL